MILYNYTTCIFNCLSLIIPECGVLIHSLDVMFIYTLQGECDTSTLLDNTYVYCTFHVFSSCHLNYTLYYIDSYMQYFHIYRLHHIYLPSRDITSSIVGFNLCYFIDGLNIFLFKLLPRHGG